MNTVRVSSKHQVVIPRPMREALGIKAGDEVSFVSQSGIVYLLPKAGSLARGLKGLAAGKHKYPRNYLKKERQSW